MGKTAIEWADRVWNPVTGCTKVSKGCLNCYAERLAKRFWGERKFDQVRWHEERLQDPLGWKQGCRVFVNSMSDLFHKDVGDGYIAAVWGVMREARQHTFMILTKRPGRMLDYILKYQVKPEANIWLGVTAEDQVTANERVPVLLRTPAAVRFVSCEPLLGAVSLTRLHYGSSVWDGLTGFQHRLDWADYQAGTAKLDWVIAGGESGPKARPMHPDWARGLRDQCKAAGTPFFFKQWGEWRGREAVYGADDPLNERYELAPREEMTLGVDGSISGHWKGYNQQMMGYHPSPGVNPWVMERVGKKAAGRLLDGQEWNLYPEVKG